MIFDGALKSSFFNDLFALGVVYLHGLYLPKQHIRGGGDVEVGTEKADKGPQVGPAGKGLALAVSLAPGEKETTNSGQSSFTLHMYCTCTPSCPHTANDVTNK